MANEDLTDRDAFINYIPTHSDPNCCSFSYYSSTTYTNRIFWDITGGLWSVMYVRSSGKEGRNRRRIFLTLLQFCVFEVWKAKGGCHLWHWMIMKPHTATLAPGSQFLRFCLDEKLLSCIVSGAYVDKLEVSNCWARRWGMESERSLHVRPNIPYTP